LKVYNGQEDKKRQSKNNFSTRIAAGLNNVVTDGSVENQF
jgi:tryptophan synthase beta subunit